MDSKQEKLSTILQQAQSLKSQTGSIFCSGDGEDSLIHIHTDLYRASSNSDGVIMISFPTIGLDEIGNEALKEISDLCHRHVKKIVNLCLTWHALSCPCPTCKQFLEMVHGSN